MIKNGILMEVKPNEEGSCNFCFRRIAKKLTHITNAEDNGMLIRVCTLCMLTIISMWKAQP